MQFISSTGKFLTRQLFWEQWIDLPIDGRLLPSPPFSLHKDKPNCINFGRAYVEERDPTGYKVATKYLGSYSHWQALLSCRWFVAAKELWDKEMDAMIQSEALDQIGILMSDGLPAQRLAAAKYLANKEYRKDKLATKGRPRQVDIDRAARDMAATDKDIADDLKRIQIAK